MAEPALSALHAALYDAAQDLAIRPSPYYAPESWIPHITLNPGHITAEQLTHIISVLSAASYTWDLVVDNVALICDTCGEQGIHYRYTLGHEP